MPLFSTQRGLVYFVHVPRTGGSNLEDYLGSRFGPLSLLDRDWMRAWTAGGCRSDSLRSSPQHLTAADAGRLLPRGTVCSLAVVRDPLARIVSEFRFQNRRGLRRRRLTEFGFSTWLPIVLEAARRDPRVFDNHIRPQCDMVPADADVFRLEAGLGALVARIDELAGSTAPDIPIGSDEPGSFRGPVVPSRAALKLIAEFYADDYARFGYALPDAAGASHDRLAPARRIVGKAVAAAAIGMYFRGTL